MQLDGGRMHGRSTAQGRADRLGRPDRRCLPAGAAPGLALVPAGSGNSARGPAAVRAGRVCGGGEDQACEDSRGEDLGDDAHGFGEPAHDGGAHAIDELQATSPRPVTTSIESSGDQVAHQVRRACGQLPDGVGGYGAVLGGKDRSADGDADRGADLAGGVVHRGGHALAVRLECVDDRAVSAEPIGPMPRPAITRARRRRSSRCRRSGRSDQARSARTCRRPGTGDRRAARPYGRGGG